MESSGGNKSKEDDLRTAEGSFKVRPSLKKGLATPTSNTPPLRRKTSFGTVSLKDDRKLEVMDHTESSKKVKTKAAGGKAKSVAINGFDLSAPPTSFFKTVNVTVDLTNDHDIGVVFSVNYVVRSIKKDSPAYFCLIVGDQILDANKTVPINLEDLTNIILTGPPKCSLTVLRVWNIKPITTQRQPIEGKRKRLGASFHIVDFYRFRNMKNGFEIKYRGTKDQDKHCVVSKIDKDCRSAYAFRNGDRILDVDTTPIHMLADLSMVKKKFNDVMIRDGVVSLLIERPLSLNSTPNPSLFAKEIPGADPEMGEDVLEIGSREAAKHFILKNK